MIKLSFLGFIKAIRERKFSSLQMIFFLSFLTLICNIAAFRFVFENADGNILFTIFFSLFSFFLSQIVYSLLLWPIVSFILFPPIIILNALSFFGAITYKAFIDKTMMRNLWETHSSEVWEYITPRSVFLVTTLGVLPLVYFLLSKISFDKLPQEFLKRIRFLFLNLVGMGLIFGLYSKVFVSFLRSHREVKHLVAPINYGDASRYFLESRKKVNKARDIILPDAEMSKKISLNRKTLFIMVVGETARASHFSLNGYKRPTNPNLSQKSVINFSHTFSCGTNTATSLPCMFSKQERKNFHPDQNEQFLTDVLDRLGFSLLWLDNNSGCKGVCDRIPHKYQNHLKVPSLCPYGTCFDEVLTHSLEREILKMKGNNLFLILHQLGSHGPHYSKRYPQKFQKFKPTCDTGDFGSCSRKDVVNTYDNTLLYTDHVLAQILSVLEKHPEWASAFLYVSDHGESLGENGVYLHGLPYWVAPKEQIHVPMVWWFSPLFREDFKIKKGCFESKTQMETSHDFLFHSILGLYGIKTKEYQQDLDLFSGCLE